MAILGWLDPSLSSNNLGDQIISEAVFPFLKMQQSEIVRLPTQRLMTREEAKAARGVPRFVVGGTNIINGNIPRYIQWRIDPRVYMALRHRVSLLAVGWWQYQEATNRLSARIWRSLLSDVPQSVRDTYTQEKLSDIGVEAINTSCVTMWNLPPSPESRRSIGDRVVVTLTDYNQSQHADERLFSMLESAYDRVIVWPQGSKDANYIRSLRPNIQLLQPTVEAFSDAVSQSGTDYVGTRLHAGVRALQLGRRATILAVDNRAREIASDTGLPVVSRALGSEDVDFTLQDRDVTLRIPHAEIREYTQALEKWLSSAPVSQTV